MPKMSPTVRSILKRLGACDEALEWSNKYGTDKLKAWRECEDSSWMMWLIKKTVVVDQGSDEHRKLVGMSAEFAEQSLPNYEKEYPNDRRVRDCIEARKRFADGKATVEELREHKADAAADAAAVWAAVWEAVWEALWAADAVSSTATCDIIRKHYPRPPRVKKSVLV